MKSELKLDYYTGQDEYSDGRVEHEIFDIFANNLNIENILKVDNRWPILYHLSPFRRNLLEWYEFGKDKTLLEIGAGCGALTGLFCEKLKSVSAIEPSKQRAEVIAERHKSFDNLDISVGYLNDVKLNKQFDFVTSIGVLEYAGMFTDSSNPFEEFLIKATDFIKPGGTLILAIENKFGLKYWAGSREDHTKEYFSGLEDYREDIGVKTFSKAELINLLTSLRYKQIDFYYPMPDYKIPTQIFSDSYELFINELNGNFPNYDLDKIRLFDTASVLKNLAQNNMFDFFANSFLIFASKEK